MLLSLYAIQLLSPMRVDNDSVAYLLVATSIADTGIIPHGNLPLGYPTFIAALVNAGLDSPQMVLLVNYGFILIGLLAVWRLARDRSENVRRLTVVFTLLSFPLIRISLMAFPDSMYFGLSLAVIALTSEITSRFSIRNIVMFVLAALLSVAALSVRIAGLTLAVPLIWVVVAAIWGAETGRRRRVLAATMLSTAIVAVLGVTLLASEGGTLLRYVGEVKNRLDRAPFAHMAYRASVTLRGLGEVGSNVPVSRIRPFGFARWMVGLIPAVFFFLAWRRMRWQPQVLAYVIAYVTVLLVWPFYAPRLWIPIVPILLLHGITAVTEIPGGTLRGKLARAYGIWFAFAGTAGFAYTSWVSLSGDKFPSRYGVSGGLSSPGHEISDHNRNAKVILRRFDGDNPVWKSLDSLHSHLNAGPLSPQL